MMSTTIKNHTSTDTNLIYDVIISGAGPVGLFLACELALAKCSVLILEKADDRYSPLKKLPFGLRGLNATSIEALHRRGLLEDLQLHKQIKNPHLKQGNQRQGGHFAGIVFYEDHIDTAQWKYRLPGKTQTSLITEIEELETILHRRATTLGVTIEYGEALKSFQQTDESITVQSEDQIFQSKWLVGCDGSRSIVRKTAGFEFAGTEPEFTGYSTKIDLLDTEKLSPGRNVTPTGMYLQSQPGYVIIQDFDGGAFHHSKKPITPEHIQQVLRKVSNTDVTVTALHIATTWTDRARQATTYRNGRILLAGDAAHIHAPLGGQGLNLGLEDAMNLGWKLAATIKGKAPQTLLDTYYTERHPIGEQVLDWSRAQVAIMQPNPHAKALYAIFRDLMNTKDGATYFAGRIWGVNTHYKSDSQHPLVGRSVPDFELENGTTIGQLMHTGKAILLDFNTDANLEQFVAEYGNQIEYISNHAKDQLGFGAILIRPDGIVAWVSETEADYSELYKAIARWFAIKPKIEH